MVARGFVVGLWGLVLLLAAGCRTIDAKGTRGEAPALADGSGIEDYGAIHRLLLECVRPGGLNDRHARRLFAYAPRFARAAGADVDVVRTGALLHDAMKERGRGDGKVRFCTHGEQGADWALEGLVGLGHSPAFARTVARAIREHMGPLGENRVLQDLRFMSKFCAGYTFPAPSSPEAKALYDIDMLDLMTVSGLMKVVALRQGHSEFGPESLQDSAETGKDSAFKSVLDAGQTLITPLARACGVELTAHTRRFLDGVDWTRVIRLDALEAEARNFLDATPLPSCLPDPRGADAFLGPLSAEEAPSDH